MEIEEVRIWPPWLRRLDLEEDILWMEVEGTLPWVCVVIEVSYNIYYFSTWFWSVSVSSLDYFSSVGTSSKTSQYYLPLSLSLVAHNVQKYFKEEERGIRKR